MKVISFTALYGLKVLDKRDGLGACDEIYNFILIVVPYGSIRGT